MYYPGYYNYGYQRKYNPWGGFNYSPQNTVHNVNNFGYKNMYVENNNNENKAENITLNEKVSNTQNQSNTTNTSSTNSNDTIKFDDYFDRKKEKQNTFNMLGFSFEIDDLIILALIFLLFQDLDNNLSLIIILGLMLLNINLRDVLSLF